MIYVNDIKETLKHYNLSFEKNSKKNKLKEILFDFLSSTQTTGKNEKLIVKIQRLFRKKL